MAGTAIFDLDRTITRKPTWTRFCFYANRDRLGFWVRVPLWMARGIALKLGLADRQSYKRYSLWLLSAMDQDEIAVRARAFAKRDVETGLRPGAVAALQEHRERGDRLIMATACCRFLACHYSEFLGFDTLIATEVSWEPAAGLAPPRLQGENCYGVEKLARVNALAGEAGFDGPVYAYSDHVSDLELLRSADYGFAVNPSSGLQKAAEDGSVRVVDFDSNAALAEGR